MTKPPWIARRLLRALAPPGEGDALVRDLEDEARQMADAHGLQAAQRWVVWQTWHSLAPLARGRVRTMKQHARMGGIAMTHGWSTDFKQAARRLVRSPGFALVGILTLALGTGASSAIFSLAYATWLKPLPEREPDRLVVVQDVHSGSGRTTSLSGPEVQDLREGTRSFTGVAAFSYGAQVAKIGDERVRMVSYSATPNLFDVLGVSPAMGRPLTSADVGQPVLVLSYAAWVSRFGHDPAILSRTFQLSGRAFSIVGVMPAGFRFPDVLSNEAWLASNYTDWTDRSLRYIQVIGRLAPNTTIEHANSDVSALAARLALAYPATNTGWSAKVVPFDGRSAAGYGAVFGSLLGLVGLFLLVGCTNLAGLLIARNLSRQGELAVCASLGASRWRLARQTALEAVALAAMGGLVGIALSSFASRALAAAMPSRLPGLEDVQVNGPVLVFAIGLSILTALASSILPAIGARVPSASEALTGARRSGPRSQRLQSALVVCEIAAAMVLIVGANLMTHAFNERLNRDRGYDPHGVLALNVSVPFEQDAYLNEALRAEALQGIVDRAKQLPGVTHVGATNGFPGSALGILGIAELRTTGSSPHDVSAAIRSATPDYFAAMAVQVKAGRAFTADDRPSSAPVVIINETLAHQMWPDVQAVGQTLLLPDADGAGKKTARTVVGVVSDMHLGATSRPDIFLPVAQRPAFWVDLVLRTNGDPASLMMPLRRALRDLNPDLLIENSTTIDAIVSNSLGLERAQATLASVVAVLSAVVAGVGLYALLAFSIVEQTREIGIRLALGSAPRALFWWMFSRGMRLAVAGIACGLVVTLGLVQMLRAQVFGLSSESPWAYASSAVMLAAIAAVAIWAPVRRVLRADPMLALRRA
jgi:putative ABC transport system permease protein